ncbi:hypothetical protein KAR04_00165 [Candidatus Calescamantes bacterium]|nr:hypothetical protein [Candidatus Calescamantes bacterium]
MVEVGSMEIVGLFKDMNLFSSLAKVKTELRTVTEHVKSTTTEMFRMSNQTKMLSGFLGAIGVGGFAALLMTMPRVGTQLEIIHMYLELIALIMDETLGPAVEWVAEKFGELYYWFKALNPETQALITWLTILGALLLGGLGIAGILGKFGALKTLLVGVWNALVPVVMWFGRFIALPILAAASLGMLIGWIAATIAEFTGLFAIGEKLDERIEQWVVNGSILANIYQIVASAVHALGAAVSALVFGTGWTAFDEDITRIKRNLGYLKDELTDVIGSIKRYATAWGSAMSSAGMTRHAVGGFASYTGPHWVEAGEPIGMKGTESASSFGGGDTTINNNYDGATFVLQNGLDIDDFINMTSRKQAEKSAWGAF